MEEYAALLEEREKEKKERLRLISPFTSTSRGSREIRREKRKTRSERSQWRKEQLQTRQEVTLCLLEKSLSLSGFPEDKSI